MKNNNLASGGVCIRCGKPRIATSSYEEKVETSTVTYTITVCSDPECQKIVDKLLLEEEKKRGMIRKDQERREVVRREAIAAKKQASSN